MAQYLCCVIIGIFNYLFKKSLKTAGTALAIKPINAHNGPNPWPAFPPTDLQSLITSLTSPLMKHRITNNKTTAATIISRNGILISFLMFSTAGINSEHCHKIKNTAAKSKRIPVKVYIPFSTLNILETLQLI